MGLGLVLYAATALAGGCGTTAPPPTGGRPSDGSGDDATNPLVPPANLPPALTLEVAPSSVDLGLPVTCRATATDNDGEVARVTLDWGDGGSGLEGAAFPETLTHIYAASGNHIVTARATDDDGDASERVAAVQVRPPDGLPLWELAVEPRRGEAPLGVVFETTGVDPELPATLWALDFGDGSQEWSGTDAPSGVAHAYSQPGVYEAALTAWTESDEALGLRIVAIVVLGEENLPPTPTLEVDPGAGAAPLAVAFVGGATDTDGAVVEWALDFGDGTQPWSGDQAPVGLEHTYTTPGTYRATLRAIDDDGAPATRSVQIIATAPPALAVSPSALSFGLEDQAKGFGIYNNGGGTLVWTCRPEDPWLSVDGSGGTGPAAVHVIADRSTLARGTHKGSVTVSSNGGDATVAVTVEVGNHDPAVARIKAEPEALPPGGRGAVVVTASDVDGDTLGYTWTATGGTIDGSGHSVSFVAPAAEGYYTVSCTVSDGHGGVAEAQVSIGVATRYSDLDVTISGAARGGVAP